MSVALLGAAENVSMTIYKQLEEWKKHTLETALSFGPSIAGGARGLLDGDCGRDDILEL